MTGAPWTVAALLCWHLGVGGGLPKEIPVEEVRPWASGQRQVRVLIFEGARTISLRPARSVVIEDLEHDARLTTAAGGGMVTLRPHQGQVGIRVGSRRLLSRAVRIRSLSSQGVATVSAQGGWGRRGVYPGALEIRAAGAELRVVEQVGLETYVAGVVAAEVPRQFPREAMEAQAIAARTYALFHLGDHESEDADLCAQVHCQAYSGSPPAGSAAAAAVARTAGEVLAWNGLLVDALYHAACGGATAACWEVRQGKLLPYLSGAGDCQWPEAGALAVDEGPWYEGPGDPFCGQGHELRWERRFTRAQAERLIAANLGTVLGRPELRPASGGLQSLRAAPASDGSRVEWLEITTSKGDYRVRGDAIRWLFGVGRPGGSGLRSTAFTLTVEKDHRGGPRAFVFRGRGHGHGLGLCQWGARGRALAGQTAAEILAAYYPGANIVHLRGG